MAAVQTETLVDRAAAVLSARRLADADTPAMLMVSGGSDSTALEYIACEIGRASCRERVSSPV